MSRSSDPADQLARSWDANARAWTRVVRSRGIESRRSGTDAAIVDAVAARSPARVLDVGCGEGWLCRALAAHGADVTGVDGSAALIDAARSAGGAEYHHLSYEELTARPAQVGVSCYDVVVCSFSLLQEELEPLLRSFAAMLDAGGALVIQTVHPWSARGDAPYVDGWRSEEFSGMDEEFAEPMPWYYRTLSSWVRLLRATGFTIEQLLEPAHPETGDPLSLLIVATCANASNG